MIICAEIEFVGDGRNAIETLIDLCAMSCEILNRWPVLPPVAVGYFETSGDKSNKKIDALYNDGVSQAYVVNEE